MKINQYKRTNQNIKNGLIALEVIIVGAIVIAFGVISYPQLAKTGLLGVEKEITYSKSVTDETSRNNEDFDPSDEAFTILANTKKSTNTIEDNSDTDIVPNPSDTPEDESVTNPVTGFTIVPESKEITLYPGETFEIKATVNPPTVTNKNVRWVSFNQSVATVNQAGVVTAIKPGEATIQVQALQNAKADNIKVTVLSVFPTEVTLQPSVPITKPIQIYINESRLLTLDFKPNNTTEFDCIYESNKPDMLRVDSNPLGVTAINSTPNKNDNLVEVSVKCRDNNGNYSVVSSTFFEVVPKTIDTTEITVPLTYNEIEVGETYDIEAKVVPDNATVKDLVYSSSNTSVATVDSNGVVRATSSGETYITIKNFGGDVYGSEITKIVRIKVNPKTIPLKSFNFNYIVNSFYIGEYLTPTINYNPVDTSQTELIWTSSNPSVISINKYGQINALSVGTATITAASVSNPSLTYSLTITANGAYDPVQQISFTKGKYDLLPGENNVVSVSIYPSFATNKGVIYGVKDSTIALIDQKGNLRALRPGRTEITAQSQDTGCTGIYCTATAIVEVSEVGVTSVELDTKQSDKKILNLGRGEEGKIWVKLLPENVSDTTFLVDYVNDGTIRVERENIYDPSIPMITVTGQNYGSKTIKVISNNGVSDSVTVNVIKRLPTSIEILPTNDGTMLLNKGSNIYLTANVEPSTADINNVIWSSSDSSVVSINQNGLVTGLKTGTATITCKSADPDASDILDTIIITVPPRLVEYVESNIQGIYSNKGELIDVNFTVFSPSSDNTELVIESKDESIIKIKSTNRQPNESGVLAVQFEAVEVGSTTIEVTSADGGIIEPYVLDVDIVTDEILATNMTSTDERTLNLANGQTFQTSIALTPTTATNKTIKYESSNTAVAIISNTGLITAIAPGDCTITAISNSNPNLVLTYYVNVLGIPAKGIQVTPNYVVLNANELHGSSSQNLAFTLDPQNSTYTSYSYEIVSSTTREETVTDSDGNTTTNVIYPAFLSLEEGNEKVVAIEKGRIVFKIYPYQDPTVYTTLSVEVVDNNIPWDGTTISPEIEIVNGACRIYNGENLAYLGELSNNGLLNSTCQTISILNDINLGGHDFPYSFDLSIPFYGNGNTIKNASLVSGFFDTVQASGIVRDLHLSSITANFSTQGGLFANNVLGKIQYSSISNSVINNTSDSLIKVGGFADNTNGATLLANNISDISHGNGQLILYGVAISSDNTSINSFGVDRFGNANDIGYIGNLSNTSSTSVYLNSPKGFAANKPIEAATGNVKFTNGYFALEEISAPIGEGELSITFSDFYMTKNVLINYSRIREYTSMLTEDFVDELNSLSIGWYFETDTTPRLLASETETVKYIKFTQPNQKLKVGDLNQSLNLAYNAYPVSLNSPDLFEKFTTSDTSKLKLNELTGAIEFITNQESIVDVFVQYKTGVRGKMTVQIEAEEEKYYLLNGEEIPCPNNVCPTFKYKERSITSSTVEKTGTLWSESVTNGNKEGTYTAPEGVYITEIKTVASASGYESASSSVTIDDVRKAATMSEYWDARTDTVLVPYIVADKKSSFKWRIYGSSDRDISSAEVSITKWIEATTTIGQWSNEKICSGNCPTSSTTKEIEITPVFVIEKKVLDADTNQCSVNGSPSFYTKGIYTYTLNGETWQVKANNGSSPIANETPCTSINGKMVTDYSNIFANTNYTEIHLEQFNTKGALNLANLLGNADSDTKTQTVYGFHQLNLTGSTNKNTLDNGKGDTFYVDSCERVTYMKSVQKLNIDSIVIDENGNNCIVGKDRFYILNGTETKCPITGCPTEMYRDGEKVDSKVETGELWKSSLNLADSYMVRGDAMNKDKTVSYTVPTNIVPLEFTINADLGTYSFYGGAGISVYSMINGGYNQEIYSRNSIESFQDIKVIKASDLTVSENNYNFLLTLISPAAMTSGEVSITLSKWQEIFDNSQVVNWSEWKLCSGTCPTASGNVDVQVQPITSYEK